MSAKRWTRTGSLEEMTVLPGTVPIGNGRVRPTDAPGLGLELTREWLESKTV
jgi:L-alanine-DL-glutamate epimerase-like enolase superfamily enzyme